MRHQLGDPLPVVGGARIEPLSKAPNHYRSANAWVEPAAKRGTGCWFLEDGSLKCNYWKDDGGGFHSDVREETDVELKAGDTFKASPDPAFFFPVGGATFTAYNEVCEKIAGEIAE